jgi:soluble lytic murein transglycosylase-like protein
MRPTYALVPVVIFSCLSCAAWAPLGRATSPPALATEARTYAPEVEDLAREFERYQTRLAHHEVRAVAATVLECAELHGLERDLLLGVIRIESAFNNFARSDKGALGLMQVLPSTGEQVARDLGIEWNGPRTLFDPVANVRIGSAYLAWLLARYGSVDRALAAYNYGPGAIDRRIAGGRPVPVEYASNVLSAAESRWRP